MRAFLGLAPLLLASCGTLVSQNDIFAQAQNEIARRESWADSATLLIHERPSAWQLTWEVSAGSFDYSQAPGMKGLRLVPGTERELRFTRDGCLLGYHDPGHRCLTERAPSAPRPAWSSTPNK